LYTLRDSNPGPID